MLVCAASRILLRRPHSLLRSRICMQSLRSTHTFASVVRPRYVRGRHGAIVVGVSAAALALATATVSVVADNEDDDGLTEVINWSGTHAAKTAQYFEPDTVEELEEIVKRCHEQGQPIRAVGAALSPNGLGLSDAGMVSLANLTGVMDVDPQSRRVTVLAGTKVEQVVEALRPYGLTLENYASIKHQHIGGYIQTGAHGTGARLPPVDDHVVELKLITPAEGRKTLSRNSDNDLFRLAKVGLGALGIVYEVTLRCVPRHTLVERTSVVSRQQAREGHVQRLRDNKHVRYMWIPYTDAVVIVACNPVANESEKVRLSKSVVSMQNDHALQPLRDLLASLPAGETFTPPSTDEVKSMNFADLRDALLAYAPLDANHVRQCNQAEAEFWKRASGITNVGDSDGILGFECGGQQWVNECSFPAGTLANPSLADMDFMRDLLHKVESSGVPAPAPMEQRWTSASSSTMSIVSDPTLNEPVPALFDHEPRAVAEADTKLFSWVGIIMYLCTQDPKLRADITEAFDQYQRIVRTHLDHKYDAFVHWAKLEVPQDANELATLRKRLRQRLPVQDFNKARSRLDPKGILSNDFIRSLFDDGDIGEDSNTTSS